MGNAQKRNRLNQQQQQQQQQQAPYSQAAPYQIPQSAYPQFYQPPPQQFYPQPQPQPQLQPQPQPQPQIYPNQLNSFTAVPTTQFRYTNPNSVNVPQANNNTGEEKEPMLLLDVTGSMNKETSANDATPRNQTIREAILLLVKELGEKDSQAENEEEDEGGLRTITFAGGTATDIGDLNPKNLREKWDKIEWSGGTEIVPGWSKLYDTFMEEFGGINPATRPVIMALIITDGEAEDTDVFSAILSTLQDNVFVTIAIIGYGEEHDNAFKSYKRVEASNSRVKVVTFDSETNPVVIAKTLIRMVE